MRNLQRYAQSLLWFSAFLMTALMAGCGGGGQGGGAILGLPAADLVTVAVTPATATIPSNGMLQFVATATYSDGTSRNVTALSAWSSATPSVATVNSASGIASGVAVGTSAIAASFGGKTGSALLTVNNGSLLSIAVTPVNPSLAIGGMQALIATGTYSNGASINITAISSWSSATAAVATVTPAGLATGVSPGSTVVSASLGGISGSTTLTVSGAILSSIAISPLNPVLQSGATQQLTVTATYSDGSSANVTTMSAFASATPANVSVVANTGLATGNAAGSSLLSASFNGKTASTTVTVSNAVLSAIAVTPASASVAIAGTQAFVATGTYSDGSTSNITNSVTWSSGSILVGTILPSGVATGLSAGTAIITATSGVESGSASLTVTAATIPGINLGGAANFGVLAGTSITNNSGGTTLVTGDVGSPSQTVDPVQAAGFTNYKSGAILATALADLQVAITDANSRTCDVSSAAGIDLGGQTFSPGVYCYTGAISITGTFTMNGPGLYIFRTTSTLNTTANSIVALNGGATAGNVFWVPVGPTTLGANSFFKGTLMGQSAAITLGDNANLQNGRVLTGSAATLRNNVISR